MRLRAVVVALVLAGCSGTAVPSLSVDQLAWCRELTNSTAVIAAANELGIDPSKEILVEDWETRDGFKRACATAYDEAH